MPTHSGSCHCGAVRFEVEAPVRLDLVECNCSMCSRVGYLHLFVGKSDLTLLSGEAALTSYRFNTRVACHTFCATCGIKPFYVPRSHPDGYSVNARCLDPSTIESTTIEPFDGAHWEDQIAGLRSRQR